jgi:hypothetical protein
MPDAPPVTVTKLMKQQESNKLKEQQLQEKRAKIRAFQGLPPVYLESPSQFVIGLNTERRILIWHDMNCPMLAMSI